MSYSLIQQGGSFTPLDIQVIKSLYCLPWATVSTNSSVYEVTTYLAWVVQTSIYTNETGDTLTLTAAQIASLIPWGCDKDYEYDDVLVCAAWVTLEMREITVNWVSTWVVVFYNPTTNLAVATPWAFTYGACILPKIPVTAQVVQWLWAVTIPANARREVVIYNTSTRDALITWTGSTGWGGTFIVKYRWVHLLSLTEIPFEWTISTIVISAGIDGVGAIASNQITLNFKN